MKIITNDAVYVQYCDIFNIIDIVTLMKIECPTSVSRRCFRNDIVVDGDNRYAFMEFKEKDAIAFFKKLDCIIDYSSVFNKSEEELLEMIKVLFDEATALIDKYNKMNTKNQNKNYHKMHSEYHLKSYKAHSIRDYLKYKKGEIKFDIPDNLKLEEIDEKPKEKNLVKTIIDIF